MEMKKMLAIVLMTVLAVGLMAPSILAKENQAMVRVLHASPDAPAVDVYVDDQEAVKGAKFKDATGYLTLPAGKHDIAIYAAGTKGKEKPVLTKSVEVEGGKAYTVAAINSLANLELKATEDATAVPKGKTKLRVGHLSPDAPTVDVGLIGGATLFSNASFPTITDYIEIDPGTYDLEVRTLNGVQVLDLSGTTVAKDTAYSAFAVGNADNLEVIVLKDFPR